MKRVRVEIEGHVQGVFFRAACARRARELGLGGSVRNRPDGRVEAAFEGEESAVRQMVDWCRRGPSGARVERVVTADEAVRGESEFSIAG